MTALSRRQYEIWQFLRSYVREHDYAPSTRDIQIGCDISSTSVVDYNLKALERMGYISRKRDISRAIRLLKGAPRRMVRVPVIGELRPDLPILTPIPRQTGGVPSAAGIDTGAAVAGAPATSAESEAGHMYGGP